MTARNHRVVTYLNEKYKNKLRELCEDREEKEATIVRQIIIAFLDQRNHFAIRKEKSSLKSTAA